MGLKTYHHKRNFTQTTEPIGQAPHKTTRRLSFVVQEHHASHLHYDVRLEMDGVLKSWAVPKGPSTDPHQHHLAVRVEDHPYEYRDFEGEIPEDNYGAGTVIIWDEGWYEAREGDPTDSEATLRKGLKKGHLTFVLHGKKLKGEYALTKLHPNDDADKSWLMLKKKDDYASQSDITKLDTSVRSQKRVDEIGNKERGPMSIEDYPKKANPWPVDPMLCTLIEEPFNKADWLFEIKWDGYRAIGAKKGDTVQLYSRTKTPFDQKFPPIAEALRTFKHDVIVDGEIVVLDEVGTPHFEWLQNWNRDKQGSIHYYIFDILWCDGRDIRTMPLKERRALLDKIRPKNDTIRFSADIAQDGKRLFEEMEKRHMEGIVAKDAMSHYNEGERGENWLKIKTHLRQEVVIGGYTEPRGSRQYIGSLVVGVYDKGKFVYVGHSGGGIPDKQRKELLAELQSIERDTSPFSIEPKPNAPVHWVEPKLVGEVSFSEWTKEGYMRQPEFKGLRPDKKPTNVHRELPKEVHISTHKNKKRSSDSENLPFEVTHADKVFFPKHGYTKGDLISYYKEVAEYILPYLKDRPCSLLRMPNGITGESFFQKNNEHLPEWVPRADIFSESNNADLHWIVSEDITTLLYMVQLGCVEINPWNSRQNSLDKPDWGIIDLDPEEISFKKVIEVAKTVKEVCDEWRIPTYPKTSGKTGLHIFIPMGAKYTYEQVKNLAHLVVLEVNKRLPTITSVERMPEKRHRKVYLDYLQNREGQTLATAYSVRPTADATVSMPLKWEEVMDDLLPTDFNIKNALTRLKHHGDLWKPVLGKGIDMEKILSHIPKISE